MPAIAVEIDGRIDPGEWHGAQHVTDFRLTQPLSRAPAPQPTEAWILATPDGLAIAFRNTQPATVPRNRQRGQRDNGGAGRPRQPVRRLRRRRPHRLQLHGDAGQQHQRHHHHQREPVQRRLGRRLAPRGVGGRRRRGTAEMLIPWHIAPMRERRRRQAHARHRAGPGDQRDRRAHVVAGGELHRAALPDRAVDKVEVPAFSQSLLAITPYVVGIYDNVADGKRFRCRRRHLLEAERPLPAQRHAQSGLRPGRERRAGGQLQRHRELLQRQASVLHREPGLLRRAVRLAQPAQPADLHAPRRRARGRRRRLGRRHRRGQAQRQRRGLQLRRVRGQRRRRRRPRLLRAARARAISRPATSARMASARW